MRTSILSVILSVVFVAGVILGTSLAGPEFTPWFLGAWSVAFTWSLVALARGSASVALAIVFVVTVLLPIVALFIVGWSTRDSISGLTAAIVSAFYDRGMRRAVEFFGPMVAAMIVALIVRRRGTAPTPVQ